MDSKLRAPFAAGLALASFAAACVLLLALASTALAADEHTYDPALSLSGGTGTTALDPIPDPGTAHPTKGFNNPCGVTTDEYGDIYVANSTSGTTNGVIDVFGPDGKFITEVPDEHEPCSVAVDSTGHLYVLERGPQFVVRYDPIVYEPAIGKVEYNPSPVVVAAPVEIGGQRQGFPEGLALDPSNDHLYVRREAVEGGKTFDEFLPDGSFVRRFGSEPESAIGTQGSSIAVWGQTHDIYLASHPFPNKIFDSRVYVLDATTHEAKLTLDGSNTSDGDFGFISGIAGLALDQSNGEIYVDAVREHHAVDQFDNAGTFIGQLKLPSDGLKLSDPFNAIAVDSGAHSPNQGYVYVTSGASAANSHLYAFAPRDVKPPEARGAHVASVGEDEARLAGEVNPNGAETSYRFEYGAADCASSPCQSVPAGGGQAGAGAAFKPVASTLEGLSPGTTYHFRLIASSHCNAADPEEECVIEGPDRTFKTFAAAPSQSCPNAATRVGPSAELPECRAYELVTPPDTGGLIPTGVQFGFTGTESPPVLLASAGGDSVTFGVEGGSLSIGNGGGYNDTYVSTRGASGWGTEFSGLTGTQASQSLAGGVSADHTYSLWAVVEGAGLAKGRYLRGPGGTAEPVGVGSLGSITDATPHWISPNATHLIFSSGVQLEPGAPPSGRAVYDRSPGGPTHIVSLLPGNVPLGDGENASYVGASAQGDAVAFGINAAIYERIDNAETVKVVDNPATFGGISADGSRVFYVKGGNIFSFDSTTQSVIQVGSGGQSTMVNVSPEGSHVYFVSPLVLSGTEANSHGDKAKAGAENLYAWDEAEPVVRFIATVTEEDVIGEPPPIGGGSGRRGGLGLWTSDVVAPSQNRQRGLANDPSRTTEDGSVFVFESRAKLSDYDNEGRSEVYRYEASAADIECVSCNPTGVPASSEARLESRYAPFPQSIPPVNAVSVIDNLAAGGNQIFFQSADRLAPGDVDGMIDVYEWLAQGTNGCAEQGGCIRLISGGDSPTDDYLYGASEDGSSVFFLSADRLLPQDPDATQSIYVAQVNGGFPTPPSPPADCLGEACQPAVSAPDARSPNSSSFTGPGNPGAKPTARCPKGRRKVAAKSGKARCLKPHAKSKHRHAKKKHRTHTDRRAAQ